MLAKFLPGSLFGRLFVAIVAVVLVTLLIILALIVRERREFSMLDSGAGSYLANIASMVEHLAQLPPPEREAMLNELREQRRSVEEMRRARLSERRENREELEKFIIGQLQRQLGDGYHVRELAPAMSRRGTISVFTENPDASPATAALLDRRPLEVEVVLPDGQPIAFRMPAPRAGPPLPRQIFLEFGILTLVLGVVLYAMTRTITRPLGDLARAADAVGRGMSVAPLAEAGSRELQAATRAFNSMQERMRRYLDSRTRVLAAMSHDLRTPLTRLRLRVESIEDEQLRNRCEADLDEMGRMISGSLAVFRGMNDDEAIAPIDVNALLEGMRDEFVEMGGAVTLEGRALQPFDGKLLALKRCIRNLTQNALRYGQHATIHVEDGTVLVIRVRDDGPGIPSEALEQVFEPFFRVESSRSRDTGGTGLGLSIARDIAQAHGGSLALRNLEPGLEAILTLPRNT